MTRKAIESIAGILDMPDIRVLEIATFYSMYNLAPVGKFFVQLCGTTPCLLRGSDSIKSVLEQRVGPQSHVSADGLFSWLEVECLGACCNAPMVQINDTYYEDLTPENFDKLLGDLAAGRPVRQGSQVGRVTSEPFGGLTSLTAEFGEHPEPPADLHSMTIPRKDHVTQEIVPPAPQPPPGGRCAGRRSTGAGVMRRGGRTAVNRLLESGAGYA